MMSEGAAEEAFGHSIDLASRWLGASVIAANDESFGAKENLLVPGQADFKPGSYSHSGEIVDGWETRRRRFDPGEDWVIVRLGCPGIIQKVDVDTSFFTGNFPDYCRIEACGMEGYPSLAELQRVETEWIEILPRSPLKGDGSNVFKINDLRRFTHIRLSVEPDGGVARLRAIGQPMPDPRLWDDLTIDAASQDHGGIVVRSSNGFYTSAGMINRPDRARSMGEGWETRRRRDAGHDHAIIKLGISAHIRQVEIDTAHFKHNASSHVEVYGCHAIDAPANSSRDWQPLVLRQRLQPDTRHVFRLRPESARVNWVRLDAFPDGGISRVRFWGRASAQARLQAGLQWFNALPNSQCRSVLAAEGLSGQGATELIAMRPLSVLDLDQLATSLPQEIAQALTGSPRNRGAVQE